MHVITCYCTIMCNPDAKQSRYTILMWPFGENPSTCQCATQQATVSPLVSNEFKRGLRRWDRPNTLHQQRGRDLTTTGSVWKADRNLRLCVLPLLYHGFVWMTATGHLQLFSIIIYTCPFVCYDSFEDDPVYHSRLATEERPPKSCLDLAVAFPQGLR